MIREVLSSKKNPALTSDRWHVVHARWSEEAVGEECFVRSIVSEHEDSSSAVSAARAIKSSLAPGMAARPLAQRDQVFVHRPGYRTLKIARRMEKRRR